MSFLQPVPKPVGYLLWLAVLAMPCAIFAAGFLFGRYL